MLSIIIVFAVIFVGGLDSGIIKTIGICVTIFCIGSYVITALKNPGIEYRSNEDDLNLVKATQLCKICNVIKLPNTMHCEDCEVCIRDYDHHCPWTGKCIGGGNLRFFYAFLFGIMAFIVFMVIAACYKVSLNKVKPN